MVGFTAAIHINGSSTTVKPILQDVLLCCSGDDGIDVHGKAQPLIRSCEIRVRTPLLDTCMCAYVPVQQQCPSWNCAVAQLSTTNKMHSARCTYSPHKQGLLWLLFNCRA